CWCLRVTGCTQAQIDLHADVDDERDCEQPQERQQEREPCRGVGGHVSPPAPSCGPPERDRASPCPTVPYDVPRRAAETLLTPPWRYPPGWRQKCPRAAPACPQRHPPWAQPSSWPEPYGLHSSSQEQASSLPTLHPSSR